MAKVIVTGSTGFIGKRLIYKLLEEGHEVYALTRIKGVSADPRVHLLYGDIRDLANMDPFPEDIDAVYYLVHSMGNVSQNLSAAEELTARNFITAVTKTHCKQIIFLGGIIADEANLSPHLRSRLLVERVLQESSIPCTILRSSIIIGAGSASFEIIRDLAEKLPVMIAPKWVKNKCQPIAIRDVLFYLTGVLLKTNCFAKTYDLGGPAALSFKDILLRYAHFRGLRRYIIDVPLLTPKLSSYWLVLITSVKFSICKYLVESMKQDTRKLNMAIDAVLPHSCLSYEESLKLAFQMIAQNEVVSTWVDDWDIKKISPNLQDYIEVPIDGCLKDTQVISITIPIDEVQSRIWCIGGSKGWYSMNWAWRLRGLIDQLVGGTGLNRGRRDECRLQPGDSIDFWRVIVADEKKRHLILYAEMKLPGEAWLEFKIDTARGILKQTATFRPKGFWGILYWYFCLPFHFIIFNNMAKTLAQKSL